MGDDALRYVICYDVPSDKRRARLAKFLDGFGDRVQYSVFEAVLSRPLFDNLRNGMEALLDLEEDSVAIYPICAACESKRTAMGVQRERPGEEDVFIV